MVAHENEGRQRKGDDLQITREDPERGVVRVGSVSTGAQQLEHVADAAADRSRQNKEMGCIGQPNDHHRKQFGRDGFA